MSLADKLIKRAAPTISTAVQYLRDATARLSPNDDWVEGFRRRVLLFLDPYTAPYGRPLVFHAHDEDYFTTADAGDTEIESALYGLYQRNAASTKKYRYIDSPGSAIPKDKINDYDDKERQWTNGSWVHDPDDTDWQHHVYLFTNDDGTTDLYGHKEPSAEKDPSGHVSADQEHGDPDGLARAQLDKNEINYDRNTPY